MTSNSPIQGAVPKDLTEAFTAKIQDYGRWQADLRESIARYQSISEGTHMTDFAQNGANYARNIQKIESILNRDNTNNHDFNFEGQHKNEIKSNNIDYVAEQQKSIQNNSTRFPYSERPDRFKNNRSLDPVGTGGLDTLEDFEWLANLDVEKARKRRVEKNRRQPPNPQQLFLKDGMDMTLHNLSTSRLRLEQQQTEISGFVEQKQFKYELDKALNDKTISRSLHEDAISQQNVVL